GIDLGGRVFLHDYDWRRDDGWSVLELILTAPMVVASWINLQYYGSTVNQQAFGSGNKVLHNVVGTLGVLEGNGGDLRVGLPMQTLHDGKRFVHEPLRLSVFVEAPPEQIDAILRKHEGARDLVDNGWLHLFALTDDGRCCLRRAEDGSWMKVDL
ncbi:MAG TPA: putative inorganic carbon transporter subunit DabA, partial [Polyangiales bacterium]|nr:putative inorganic carbon transporter subunit DabA [Polyangiales bacterium]